MQKGKKAFRCLTSLLLAVLLTLSTAVVGMTSAASAAVNRDDSKWGGVQPLITEDNYVTRNPDPEAPAAWGAIPDDAQLLYQEQELSAFIHFGVNTFTGAEWGTGTEDPKVFNPTDMKTQEEADAVAEEWVLAFQAGGFKRVIIVAKHHDGFCLWPSAYTTRDVESSSVPGIDVVLAVSRACTKYNMDMGVYLSPWDESDASYGYHDADGKAITKEQEAELIANGTLPKEMDYNYYYDLQLRELRELLDSKANGNKYGNNGKFVEVWMDGAKGSGANAQDYDMDMWFTTIHELQPDVRVFYNMASAGIHWVGNEKGITDETCWTKFDITDNGELTPTKGSHGEIARQQGLANGQVWTITECDVSIRNGWFHGTLHSMEELVQMYYNTVGHGAVWLLNVPPDSAAAGTGSKTSTGRFSAADIATLKTLGDAIEETYATNFASAKLGATATTTIGTERKSATDGKFSANNVLNDDKDSYWTLQDGVTSGQITIDLGAKRTFDLISLQEYIPLGQRIAEARIEYFDDSANTWKIFGETTTVGARKLVLGNPVTSSKVRVTVTNTTYCSGVPLLRSVGVYKAASVMSKQGLFPSDFTYIDDRDAAFTYSGTWKNEAGSEGLEDTFKGTGDNGATVTGTFTGTKFYVIGIKGPACSQVEVTIDGEPAGVFEAHAEKRMAQQVMYTSPDLDPGEHTITLKVKTGTYSAGNKTYFNFDGIYYANNENGIVNFERDTHSVKAGEETTVTITRTGGSKGRITFDVIDQPDSAVSGQHYEYLGTQHIVLEDGQTEAKVTTKTHNANESVGAKYYLKIIDVTGGAVAGVQASTCIQITDPDKPLLPNPQAPANDESFTASHPFELPAVEGASAGLEYKYIKAGSLPYNAAKAGEYTMTVCYSGSGALSWSGSNVEDGSITLPAAADAAKTAEVKFTVSAAGAGTLTLTTTGSPAVEWLSFKLDEAKYIPVESITLNKTAATVYTNESSADHTVKLNATLAPAGASGTVEWTSSDENVATVAANGLVTAVGDGVATITAAVTTRDNIEVKATATITVYTKMAGVSISGVAFAGQELKAVLDPAGANATYEWMRREAKDGTWMSLTGPDYGDTYRINDDDVEANIFVWATGSGNSLGTVRSGGTARIQGADDYVGVTGVTLNKSELDLARTKTETLIATVQPENASVKTGQWMSSDESVATVSEDGVVTALKEGSAVITVTTDDGGFTAACTVTVTQFTSVTGVTLSKSIASLNVGETAALTATVVPADAHDKTVTWTTSDASVATVSASGVVTALKAGEAEITVTTTDGRFTATCTVTVTAVTELIPVTGVTLTPSAATLTVGGTATLTAAVAPAYASDKTVTWTTSNASVATVSASGVVTALKAGSAVITVTTADGGFTATCAVTVTAAAAPETPTDPGSSGSSDSSGSSTIVTTVTKNEDGSTTITVTDKSTGVVTETTKWTDGTVEVVESKPDGTVTKTVTDPEGGKAEKVTAPDQGVTITVTDSTGEVLVKAVIPAEIPELETRFVDVPENHWADEAIHTLAALEIVNGVGDNRYDMQSPVTRGALATVLFRMSNGNTGYEVNFDDVDNDMWYADGIAWAARTKVVNGTGDGNFAPDSPITREQLATMLYRYAVLLKLDTKASADALNMFTDGEQTSSWAVEAMAWCVENGILRGTGNNTLDPWSNASRAETAVMIQRFMNLMK